MVVPARVLETLMFFEEDSPLGHSTRVHGLGPNPSLNSPLLAMASHGLAKPWQPC